MNDVDIPKVVQEKHLGLCKVILWWWTEIDKGGKMGTNVIIIMNSWIIWNDSKKETSTETPSFAIMLTRDVLIVH